MRSCGQYTCLLVAAWSFQKILDDIDFQHMYEFRTPLQSGSSLLVNRYTAHGIMSYIYILRFISAGAAK